MTEKEALIRVKTGNFNGNCGFDMQLLIDSVGIIGEMFKNGQISEVVRCKDCRYCVYPKTENFCKMGHLHGNAETWFCADGKGREVG